MEYIDKLIDVEYRSVFNEKFTLLKISNNKFRATTNDTGRMVCDLIFDEEQNVQQIQNIRSKKNIGTFIDYLKKMYNIQEEKYVNQ